MGSGPRIVHLIEFVRVRCIGRQFDNILSTFSPNDHRGKWNSSYCKNFHLLSLSVVQHRQILSRLTTISQLPKTGNKIPTRLSGIFSEGYRKSNPINDQLTVTLVQRRDLGRVPWSSTTQRTIRAVYGKAMFHEKAMLYERTMLYGRAMCNHKDFSCIGSH